MTILLFVASFVLIVVAAELFTNAVEWLGFRLRLARGATGSLLAAIGTSLPETMVPVVALVSRSPSADSVAQGSVLGAPFLLMTVATGVTGIAVALRRDARTLVSEPLQVRRDLGMFIAAFSVIMLAIVLPGPARIALGIAVLLGYCGFVVATLRSGEPNEELPEPLHIVRWREGEPHTVLITVQLVVAVLLLIFGSTLFVDALNRTADDFHLPPLILALVAVPLATELPETLNSVLWVRSRDDHLAFGNVAGSTVFQACVLGFLGLVFTSWHPGTGGVISGVLTLATAVALLTVMRNGKAPGLVLAATLIPWIGYAVAQIVTGGHLGGTT